MVELSTVGLTREGWLKLRQESIGGSDAGAIVGLSDFATPFTVWADKTGRLPQQEDNESMRQGRDLEPYVAKRFEEALGKRCRRVNRILKHPDYSFAHANIDYAVVGEKAGLECKTTTSLNLKRFRDGNFPANYYAQCVHYMAVTGWKRWYLAVLVLGQGFYWYVIERDESEISALLAAERDFWALVESDTPPDMDGKKPTSTGLASAFTETSDGCTDLTEFHQEILALKATENEIAKLRTQAERIRQNIKLAMGESISGACQNYQVLWVPHQRTYISAKRLKEVYPKINLQKVMLTKQFRRFRIKEVH